MAGVRCSSDSDRGRFSFMGGTGGPLWQRVTYWLPPPEPLTQSNRSPATVAAGGKLVVEDSNAIQSSTTGTPFFDWLEQQLRTRRCRRPAETAAGLPFDFWGGFVGYLGYELKAECGGANCHASSTPDAAFFLADRCAVTAVMLVMPGCCLPCKYLRANTVCSAAVKPKPI